MKKKNLTKFEIVCYVVAALLAVVAVYMLAENIAYMNEYLAAYGMTFTALGSQAIQSMVGAFVPYAAYAFLALAAGRIHHAVAAEPCECVCECDCDCEEEAKEETKEEAEVVEILCPKCDAVVYTFERDLIIEDEEEDEE